MTKQARAAHGLGRFGEPGLLVLLSLSAGARHGHSIVTDIQEQFDMRLGPGTLYGSIAKLCDLGLISPLPDEGRRRPYEITEAGRVALAEHLATWSSIVQVGTMRLAGA